MARLVKKIAGFTVGAGAAAGIFEWLDRGTPLHVEVPPPRMVVGGVNILPGMTALFHSLPASVRRNLIIKMSAPKKEDPKDWYDHFGTNPYSVTEVKPGKVWMVTYAMGNFFAEAEARDQMKMLGLDFASEEFAWKTMQGAENFGREASDRAHKDLAFARDIEEVYKKFDKGEISAKDVQAAVGPASMNMTVVKLNSGGLLLYSPVKVHTEEFTKWLEGLGKVEWLVVGSSAHTLNLPGIIKKYPDAKIIASKDVKDKIVVNHSLPRGKIDFDITVTSDLTEANKQLKDEGVSLHRLTGDHVASSLVAVAHQTAMECDIVYSHEKGFGVVDKMEDFLNKDEFWFNRLFKFGLCTKPNSVNDALPNYRFWMMDPAGPFRVLLPSPPKKDGSCCRDMANSLRLVLVQDFDAATSVHGPVMTGDAFRKSVERNWSWLDGQSLLDQAEQYAKPHFNKE